MGVGNERFVRILGRGSLVLAGGEGTRGLYRGEMSSSGYLDRSSARLSV